MTAILTLDVSLFSMRHAKFWIYTSEICMKVIICVKKNVTIGQQCESLFSLND